MPTHTPAFRVCEVPECAKRRYHEGPHEDTGGRVVGPCAARRPGYDTGPVWGRRTLPCVLPRDHDGPHRNAYRDAWNDTDVPDHPHNTAAQEAGRVRREQTAEVPGVVLVSVPEMFPEAIDGEPVMYQVRSTDTCAQDLGTVTASDDLSAWLPVLPDGGHGPLAPTAQSAAVWLARARVRVYTSGGSPVLPCPVSGCALLAGHSGRCTDLDGREWKGNV